MKILNRKPILKIRPSLKSKKRNCKRCNTLLQFTEEEVVENHIKCPICDKQVKVKIHKNPQ